MDAVGFEERGDSIAFLDGGIVRHTALADLCQMTMLLLQTPTLESVGAMRAGSMAPDFLSISKELGVSGVRVEDIANRFDAFWHQAKDADGLLADLRREHTRLYLNPLGALVSLYEGLFVEKLRKGDSFDKREAVLFVNPTALDAESQYRRAGLDVGSDNRFPADGITVELEYMSRLHSAYAKSLVECNAQTAGETYEWLQEFYVSHVANWMPDFFDATKKAASVELYALAADLGFLLCEVEAVEYSA